MNPRHLLMGVVLAGAAALVLFGDNSPSGDVAEPAERRVPKVATAAATSGAAGSAAATTATTAAAATSAAAAPSPRGKAQTRSTTVADTAILRLLPRAELLGKSGDASFAGNEGLFGSRNWTPPPPPPAAPPPPPPPMAPPLPYTFIGKALADGAWEVFLARGADRTFIVRNQMVIDGAYRVDSIAPPMMKLTYLPLNQAQQLNIGVPD